MREGMVSYEGLSKAEVLAALYNAAVNKSHLFDKKMTIEEAENLLKGTMDFDYINGHCIKVNLSDDEGVDPRLYDRAYGFSAGLNAILDYVVGKRIGRDYILEKPKKKKKQTDEIIDKDTMVQSSTKVIEEPNIQEGIEAIEKELFKKKSERIGAIPELKFVKWGDYAKKHPATKTSNGTTVYSGQVLYIKTLKYNYTSKHIPRVSEVNIEIEKYNKILEENGVEDARLPKIIFGIINLLNKYKEILIDCENLDDVSGAVKHQVKEIKNAKASTISQ